jgi:hypothetical protein
MSARCPDTGQLHELVFHELLHHVFGGHAYALKFDRVHGCAALCFKTCPNAPRSSCDYPRGPEARRICQPEPGAAIPIDPNTPGSRYGSTGGDPHLVTWGALRYDFMAAGEFTLLDDGTGLSVQVRQEPLGSPSSFQSTRRSHCAGATTAS